MASFVKLEGGFVYRSLVFAPGSTDPIAVLPTWSDGAGVREARPDLIVEDREYMGRQVYSAPDVTDVSYVAAIARLGVA